MAVASVAWRAAVACGAVLAAAGTAHTAVNLRSFRRLPERPPPVAERVSVLLPVRDEAARVEPCIRSLLAQDGVRDLEVLVLDDGSIDGTGELVRLIAGSDPRVRVLAGEPLPVGWWGKPWACQQLADAASGSVLVFVDADVVLERHAVAATVALLRWSGLDLVSPYPRQVAVSAGERLVQPLLQWSFLTTLPLALAERSPRPSLSAANGQLLAVDAAAYRRAGGHACVRADPVEDIGLLRSVKAVGGRGGVADGSRMATCRMYVGWRAVRAGYAKSLWAAFGGPRRAVAVCAALVLVYVVPPLAALRGSRVGLAGYAAAVVGRVAVARRVGARVLPDSLAHPLSVLGWCLLTAESVRRHRRGTLTVRGRAVP